MALLFAEVQDGRACGGRSLPVPKVVIVHCGDISCECHGCGGGVFVKGGCTVCVCSPHANISLCRVTAE